MLGASDCGHAGEPIEKEILKHQVSYLWSAKPGSPAKLSSPDHSPKIVHLINISSRHLEQDEKYVDSYITPLN